VDEIMRIDSTCSSCPLADEPPPTEDELPLEPVLPERVDPVDDPLLPVVEPELPVLEAEPDEPDDMRPVISTS